jgi:hypothetical protein
MNDSSTMISPCRTDLAQIEAVRFGSCYGYSPGGNSAQSRRSRGYRALLKAGEPGFIGNCARRVAKEVAAEGALAAFFTCRPLLIPVPSSTPTAAGAATPSSALAAALLDQGLGCAVWQGLRRCHRVNRSSHAGPGCRPTVHDHYRSLCVEGPIPDHAAFLLVDDLITKGRTLIAASMRLREAAPQARIEAFALMRTTSLVPDIDAVLDPCAGLIGWARGDARRRP